MNNTLKKLTATAMAVATMLSVSATGISADEWVKTSTGYKYELDDGSYQKKSSWVTIGKDKYYVNSKGVRATGSLAITKNGEKKYYYFDKKTGKMKKSCWITINGTKYFYRSNGERATGMSLKISGKTYKFDETGVVVTGTTKPATTTTTSTATSVTGKARTLTDKPDTVTFTTKVWYHNMKTGSAIVCTTYKAGTPVPTDLAGKLVIVGNGSVKDYDNLKYFTNICDLCISYTDTTQDGWITDLRLSTSTMKNLTNLDFMYYMPQLKKVNIYGARSLTDVAGMSACVNLKDLLVEFSVFPDVKCLATCKKLENAEFNNVYKLSSLDGIGGCKSAKQFWLIHLPDLKDIEGISELTDCKNKFELEICQCADVKSIKGVENLTKLYFLKIQETNISDLSPVVTLANNKDNELQYVSLRYFGGTVNKDWCPSGIICPAIKDKGNISKLESKGVLVFTNAVSISLNN